MRHRTQMNFLKVSCAVFACLVSLGVPLYLLSGEQVIVTVKHWGYWLMLGTCSLFLWTFWRESRRVSFSQLSSCISTHRVGLLLALIGAVFVQFQSNDGFKILYDEHVLSSTAMNLHHHQMAYAEAVSYVIDGEKGISLGHVDKRPLLFPFILSATHNLFGYDYKNVFGLNALLTFATLALLYAAISQISHRTYGWLGILLMCGLPLLAENATGGGYELLNLCLILALLLSSIYYFQNERPTGGLDLMIMAAILLANVRYESILYVLVPAGAFLLKSIRSKQIHLSWFSVFSPLLLILPLMSYAVFKNDPQFIHTTPEDFFSVSYLPENMGQALAYLINWRGDYTNSLLLTALGSLGICLFLIYCAPSILNPDKQNDRIAPIFMIVLVILANTLLALSNEWGAWTKVEASRFSLPLHLAMVICLAPALAHGFRLRKAPFWLLLSAGLYMLLVTPLHCLLMKQENRLIIPAGYQWAMQWAEESAPQGNNLFIAQSASGLGLLNKSAIPFSLANAKPEKLLQLKALGIYGKIYAVEALINTGEDRYVPLPGAGALNQSLHRTTVAEYHIKDNIGYRISRLTDVDQIAPPLGEAIHSRHSGQGEVILDWTAIYELLPLNPNATSTMPSIIPER